jgi:hypothetical protein
MSDSEHSVGSSASSEISHEGHDGASTSAGIRVKFTLCPDGQFKVHARIHLFVSFSNHCGSSKRELTRMRTRTSDTQCFQVSGGIEGTKLQLGDTLVSINGVAVQVG